MQLWCKKWFLVVAGIVLLAHNLTPHHHSEGIPGGIFFHHFKDTGEGKESHHHGNEDESDGFALHHSIDHAFFSQHSFDDHNLNGLDEALPQVSFLDMGIPVFMIYRLIPLPSNESPPGFFIIRQLTYRGPPSC